MITYLILATTGEPGPEELWKNIDQRPVNIYSVIEVAGHSPEYAATSLFNTGMFNKDLRWEVQKTNNPQVVHLFHDDGPFRIFLTVIEQQFVDFYESIPI
jgi:hypothetical protein